jgi:hypothetical protein
MGVTNPNNPDIVRDAYHLAEAGGYNNSTLGIEGEFFGIAIKDPG